MLAVGSTAFGARRHEPGRVLVIGHRGAEALAPENTWASFHAAREAGADLLEVDVQVTRDGVAVVYHDFTLWPKFRDPRWVRDVEWDELRGLDVGGWFSPAFAGERIPRLDEVLAWARGRVGLQLDLKHGFQEADDDRLESAALELVAAARLEDQVLISSWDEVALARIHARRPEIALAVNLRPRVADPVAYVAPSGARWAMVYWSQTEREIVDRLHQAGLRVCLNELFTEEYAEALRLGVDAVTARDPGRARAVLDRLVSSGQRQE
jgi:glycerophosphoryl diester phosphodiesterase